MYAGVPIANGLRVSLHNDGFTGVTGESTTGNVDLMSASFVHRF